MAFGFLAAARALQDQLGLGGMDLKQLQSIGQNYVTDSFKAQGLTDAQIKDVAKAAKPIADNAKENRRLIQETSKKMREAESLEEMQKIAQEAPRGKNLLSFGKEGKNIGAIAAIHNMKDEGVQHIGGERYGVVDLGLNDKDTADYLRQMEQYGYLPDTGGLGYEVHRSKDGLLRVSVDEPEESLAETAFKAAVTTGIGGGVASGLGTAFGGSGLLATAGKGAVQAALPTAIQGGDLDDILKSAAVGGVTAGLPGALSKVPGLDKVGNALQAKNFAGAGLRGFTNSTVKQLIAEGKLDLGDAIKSGLIQSGLETAQDFFADAGQTRDVQRLSKLGKLNNRDITPQEALRLEDTADLYGLLGKEGAFAKLGLDLGYVPTDYVGDAIDFLGGAFNRDFLITPNGDKVPILENQKTGMPEAFLPGSDTPINPANYMNQPGWEIIGEDRQGLFEFLSGGEVPFSDMSRYDERFFDLDTPRESGAPLEGIHEKNPYAYTGPSGSTPFKEEGAPTGPTGGIPLDGGTLPGAEIPTSVTPITDDIFGLDPIIDDPADVVPEEELMGTQDPQKWGWLAAAQALKAAQEEELPGTEEGIKVPPELGTDPDESLPGVDPDPIPGVDPDPDPLPGVDPDPDPEYVDEEEELKTEEPRPPITTIPGPSPTPGDLGGFLYENENKTEDNLYRLARVMGINPEGLFTAAGMMKDKVAGDATADIDKLSSALVQRFISEAKDKEQKREHMFKELQERGKSGISQGRGRG